MSNEKDIDRIFTDINNTLDLVLFDNMSKSEKVIYSLKSELKQSVNSMVWNKPDTWKSQKTAYVDVLRMISKLENKV